MKKIILIVVLVILIAGGYYYFQNKPSEEVSNTVEGLLPDAPTIEKEVIKTTSQTVVNSLEGQRNQLTIKSRLEQSRSNIVNYLIQNNDSLSGLCNSPSMKNSLGSTNYPAGTKIECNSNSSDYVLLAILDNNGWCVDSTGASKAVNVKLGTRMTCP